MKDLHKNSISDWFEKLNFPLFRSYANPLHPRHQSKRKGSFLTVRFSRKIV